MPADLELSVGGYVALKGEDAALRRLVLALVELRRSGSGAQTASLCHLLDLFSVGTKPYIVAATGGGEHGHTSIAT